MSILINPQLNLFMSLSKPIGRDQTHDVGYILGNLGFRRPKGVNPRLLTRRSSTCGAGCITITWLNYVWEATIRLKEGIELIQAQNFRLSPTLKRAGTGAEIIIILTIKPKGFRRNAQKDCSITPDYPFIKIYPGELWG